ncbi:hypothetical protein BJV77DRAFT_1013612 [Russula vinacea]|nr:hypothetical protein BJV77DRAFT_1013612 [Russula vinacea]
MPTQRWTPAWMAHRVEPWCVPGEFLYELSTLRRDLWVDGTSRLLLEKQADVRLMVLFARLALSRRLQRHRGRATCRINDQQFIVLFDSVLSTESDVIKQVDATTFFLGRSEAPYHVWTCPWRPGGCQRGTPGAPCGYRDHAGCLSRRRQ